MTRYRLSICVFIAAATHLLILLVVKISDRPPQNVAGERSVAVTLAPAPVESEPVPPQPTPEPEPESKPEPAPDPIPAPATEAVARTPEPEPAPQGTPPPEQQAMTTHPPANTAAIYRQLQRYRLEDDAPRVTLDKNVPSHPMELGYVHGELATLDRDLPEVPFADAEYQWVMYSSGIEGDVERAFDAVTKTWGFTTRYGTKVKCAWVLVIVSCGWK